MTLFIGYNTSCQRICNVEASVVSSQAHVERLGSQFWLRDVLQSGYALKLVKDSGVTYEEVADIVGVTRMQVFRYLHGLVARPRPAHALRLARLLQQLEVMISAS